MLGKKLVRRSRAQRGALWSAAVTRRNASDSMVGKLLDRIFDGSAHRLVSHLLETDQLTDTERAELARLLKSNRKKS